MRRFFLLSITLLLHVSSTTWAATVNLDTGSGTIPYPGSTDISSPLFTNSCVTAKLGFTGVVNTIYFFRFELFNATFVKTPIKSNFLLNTSSLTLGEPYVPQVSSVTGDDRIIVSATVGSSNVNPDSSFTLCFPSGLYMQSGSKAVELKYSAYAGQSDAHYEANVFAEAKATLAYIEIFSVTLDTKGIGSVSGAGKFKEGETVNLTATPAPWHILTSWSPSPCAASFEMPRNDLTCTATFMPEEFTLTLNKIGRGVFSGGGNSFIFGDPVNLKAAPAYGYTFSGWEPEPCASSFSMPGSDLTCTAIFTQIEESTSNIVLNLTQVGNGTVSGDGTFTPGSQANLTAIPDNGYTFDGWSPAPCADSFVIPENNLTCTATFSKVLPPEPPLPPDANICEVITAKVSPPEIPIKRVSSLGAFENLLVLTEENETQKILSFLDIGARNFVADASDIFTLFPEIQNLNIDGLDLVPLGIEPHIPVFLPIDKTRYIQMVGLAPVDIIWLASKPDAQQQPEQALYIYRFMPDNTVRLLHAEANPENTQIIVTAKAPGQAPVIARGENMLLDGISINSLKDENAQLLNPNIALLATWLKPQQTAPFTISSEGNLAGAAHAELKNWFNLAPEKDITALKILQDENLYILTATESQGTVALECFMFKDSGWLPYSVELSRPPQPAVLDVAQSKFEVSSQEAIADNNNQVIVTLQAYDNKGNPLTNGGDTVALNSTGSALISQVTDNQNGTYSAALTNSIAEIVSVSGMINEEPLPYTVSVKFTQPPSIIAPPVDDAGSVSMKDAIDFLYDGDNAAQTGVSKDAIDAEKVAVIRGKVVNQNNQALADVSISIKDHPELGQTVTRADGQFDMAVNGGDALVVEYNKPGYLTVQRPSQPQAEDFAHVDTVVLTAISQRATKVTLNETTQQTQVVQSEVSNDSDGSRQATLVFQPGVSATMEMENGTIETLDTMNVRVTEFTVGENGTAAMPGPLPESSAYTYAVNLSADEAITAGAKDVSFTGDVPIYVDNFLDFPVGEPVPVGWYNEDTSVWEPGENGLVIKIINETGGKAVLDVTRDDTENAATQAQLDAFKVTDAELEKLASLYAPGKSLWRVVTRHFSTPDFNWPGERNTTNVATPLQNDETGEFADKQAKENPDCYNVTGCIITPLTQVLGEDIPIIGTPFNLHYQSDRVPDRKMDYAISAKLIGNEVPSDLASITFTVDIAGQHIEKTYPAEPNQTATWVWNGLDVYGRPVYGTRTAVVKVHYNYNLVYFASRSDSRLSFGLESATREVIGRRSNATYPVTNTWTETLGNFAPKATNLGGWSLNVHHAYVPQAGFFGGDGDNYEATGYGNKVTTIAPNVSMNPWGIALDSKNNIYIADNNNNRVIQIDATGAIKKTTSLSDANGAFVDDYDNIYLAGYYTNCRVYKMASDGTLGLIAGTGGYVDTSYFGWWWGGATTTCPFGTDGNLATKTGIGWPYHVVAKNDGTFYVVDYRNHALRKVTPDGILSSISGLDLYNPTGLAIAENGDLYIVDQGHHRIIKLKPDGTNEVIAGTGEAGYSGDGGLATEAQLNQPVRLTVTKDGSLFIADSQNHCIRKVDSEGIISTVIGTCGVSGSPGDEETTLPILLNTPYDLTFDDGGSLYIVDGNHSRIRKIEPTLDGVELGETIVPSRSGDVLYLFNASGRHLSTTDALTGQLLYGFTYTARGLLSTIIDMDNRITKIERDAQGNPLAIVSPDGQRTALGLDDNGWLELVANPANEAYRMEYTPGGLMLTYSTPENTSTVPNNRYGFDELGRLEEDRDRAGGGWTLERAETDNGYQVSLTSGEQRTSTTLMETLENGQSQQTNFHTDGTVSTTVFDTDGSQTLTRPDGTRIISRKGPDPRFGMTASLPAEQHTLLPSGLLSVQTYRRDVELKDITRSLEVASVKETTVINGNATTSVFSTADNSITTTTPEGRTAVSILDTKGREKESQVTGLTKTLSTYTPEGRLATVTQGEDTAARATVLTYYPDGAAKGYLKDITDAENRSVSFTYDAAGRVKTQALPDTRVVGYDYYPDGSLKSITPPGRDAHFFSYTAQGLTDNYTPPALDGTNTVTAYQYNKDKQVELITRPDGQTLDFQYNAASGKLDKLVVQGGEYVYGYDTASGQLKTVTAPDATLTFSYDGMLQTGQSWSGTVSGSVSESVNNDFRVESRTVAAASPSTASVSFAYDDDGLLTGAGDLSITREAQKGGLLKDTTLGKVTTSRSYNDFGELSGETVSVDGSVIAQWDYTQRDKLGRIKAIAETVQGGSRSLAYQYDLAGRLWKATQDGITTEYGYDSNSNRTQIDGATVATYDAQDRLKTYNGVGYSYTANGELLSKTESGVTTNYTYDVLGNLRLVDLPNKTVSYVTDGSDRRIGKKVNGTLVQGFLYKDQLNPVAELDADGNLAARFIYADKANVPAYMLKDGQTYRIVSDHLGSPRLVINTADGSVAQRMDYDVWGKVTNDTNPGFQPFGFAGGLYDADTGLVRFGARDYDPQTGRWTAKDPIGFDGGDVNLYGYVFADPINFLDPNGKLWFVASAILGAAFEVATQLAVNGGDWTKIDVSDVVVAGAVSAVGLGVVSNVGRLYSKGKAISKTEKTLSKLERSLYKSKSNKVKKRMQGKVDKYNDKLWKQNANFTSDLKGSIWVAGGTVIVKKANDLISEPCP